MEAAEKGPLKASFVAHHTVERGGFRDLSDPEGELLRLVHPLRVCPNLLAPRLNLLCENLDQRLSGLFGTPPQAQHMTAGLASRTIVGVVVQHLGEVSVSEQRVDVKQWIILIAEVLEPCS